MENLEIVFKVLNGINQGVLMENDTVRAFDGLDYLELTNIDIFELVDSVKSNLQATDVRKLMEFANKSFGKKGYLKPLNELGIKNIMEVNVTKNIIFDEHGNVIPNSGRTITEEEKIMIIDLLLSTGGIATVKTFNNVVDRIVNNYPLTNSRNI